MYESTIFVSFGNWIDTFFDFLKDSNTGVVQTLSSLLALTVTIQIMFKAYQTFGGKVNEPIKELVWDIAIRMIIVGVALNFGGYLDTIKFAMENLQNIMSGSESLYSGLDKKLDATLILISRIWENVGVFFGDSIGLAILTTICVLVSFFLGVIPAFVTILMTSITLKLLMLVLPLVLFAQTYPWFKNIFQQWLGLFVSNLFTVFIVGTVFNIFSEKYASTIETLNTAKKLLPFPIMSDSLIMGIVLFGIFKVAADIAEKLGNVSIEKLASQSIANSFRSSKDKLANTQKRWVGAKNYLDNLKNKR